MPKYDVAVIRRQTLRSTALIEVEEDTPRGAAEKANAIPVNEIE